MKHINFIQTVHPHTKNAFYRWLIWSLFLLFINFFLMGWFYFKQWHHINELIQEKNQLICHQQEHNDITACKKNLVEKKKLYEQKMHKIDCNYSQPKHLLVLLNALIEAANKNNIKIQSFIMQKQAISLQCVGATSGHILPFTHDLGKIAMVKEIELVSLEKNGAEMACVFKGKIK